MKEINNGVYPTMITPFTDDNKIDYNGVKELLDWYAKKGVDGIFAICQSSEIFFLSFEERLELLKFIMALARINTATQIDIIGSISTKCVNFITIAPTSTTIQPNTSSII